MIGNNDMFLLIRRMCLLLMLHCNCVPIFHRLSDVARYWVFCYIQPIFNVHGIGDFVRVSPKYMH